MSFLVIVAGLATFVAALGVGLLALAASGARPPSPWREAVAVVLGLSTESTLVQALAMASLATRPALAALWVVFVAVGSSSVLREMRSGTLRAAPAGWRPRGGAEWAPLALGVVALATNLLVAAAPSTKIDEVHYHMLVPRRIVEDGALRAYLFPWEAGALPQMTYQIGAAPLHAFGLPDSWNVVSWALAATLAWLGWWLLFARGDARRPLAGWWVAVVTVGLYGAVWHVTGGAHALGDLALAAALVAAASPGSLDAGGAPRSYALAVGALTWAAASTKATLVPVSALLLAWALRRAWRLAHGRDRAAALAAGVAPWIVFGAPIALRTWQLTGTPYGPLLAALFPQGLYDASEVGRLTGAARRLGQRLPLADLAARHTPLLWAAAIGGLVATRLPRATRLTLATVVAAQVVLVAVWLPWDPRFLAGIPLGLALLFAMHGPWPDAAPRTMRLALATSALLLAPWLAAQLVYAAPLAAATLGVTSRERFLTSHVALYDDWRRLDALLPRDAVLLNDVGRTSLFYAPRRVLVDVRDVASDERGRVYVLGFTCERRGEGPVVYTNPSAVVATYRTPGRAAARRAICVRKLAPS